MPAAKHIVPLLLLSLLCFASSCRQKQHHDVTRGFYYWKTVYRPTPYEQETMQRLQVSKMYIRLFDVDLEKTTSKPIPIAPIQLPRSAGTAFDIVPVVFITQKTVAGLQQKDVASLSDNISNLISSICGIAGITPKEIQIDCDWTAGTRDIYFSLLGELRQQAYFRGKKLSCTIRMHQVKYTTSSGIPPVDKGLLMCYSMGDLKNAKARNSILDVSVAKEYLKRISTYTLPLDIALPIFQWCILFRDNRFIGILHDVSSGMVVGNKLFTPMKDNKYSCTQDTVWNGIELKANDMLRVEAPSYKELMDIASFTSQQLVQREVNVLLFSCDSIYLSKYSTDELEAVYNTYR